MSVVVTMAAAGVVAIHAPVLVGMATAVAASMGLRVLDAAVREGEANRQSALVEATAAGLAAAVEEVEVTSATAEALKEVVAERTTVAFGDDRVTVTLSRDIRGRLTVRAHGRGMTRAEVNGAAERFLGLVLQQVAYREAVRMLKAQGLSVDEEARLEDGTVRVRLKRG